MDPSTAVERALAAFCAAPAGDWGGLRAAVAAAGVPDALAGDIMAFVPIAFGRALLDGMGIEFSPDYAVAGGTGEARVAGRLLDHPVYAAAADRAREMLALQQDGDTFVAAAVWSSELAAVNEALHAGSTPSDLVAGPPVLLGGTHEAEPPSTERP